MRLLNVVFSLDTVSYSSTYSKEVTKFARDIGSKHNSSTRDLCFYLKCKSQIGTNRVKLAEQNRFRAFRPVCSVCTSWKILLLR